MFAPPASLPKLTDVTQHAIFTLGRNSSAPSFCNEKLTMSDHVYKIVNIVGSSKNSSDEAIQNAIARLAESGEHLDWFEVVETRGHIVAGKIGHYQVVLKVGFRLESKI